MAKDNRMRKAGVPSFVEACCFVDEDEASPHPHNSPSSPTNLRYARSHEELSGRPEPSLSRGVSFSEKLETEDYWNWD